MQNFNKKVTRNDVAKLAGTSSAVVSYVINNGPKPVSEKTRKKVLEAIKITGYQPNNIARALVSGKSRCLGLIIPNISNPFIASLAHAIEGEAIDRGFVILLGDSDDREDKELDLLKFFLQRQVDGIIYNAIKDPYLDLLSSSNTPFVLLNHMASLTPGLRVVKINEYQASYDVVKMMIAKGYRKIAIICGPKSMHNTQERIRGWKSALISPSLKGSKSGVTTSSPTNGCSASHGFPIISTTFFSSSVSLVTHPFHPWISRRRFMRRKFRASACDRITKYGSSPLNFSVL